MQSYSLLSLIDPAWKEVLKDCCRKGTVSRAWDYVTALDPGHSNFAAVYQPLAVADPATGEQIIILGDGEEGDEDSEYCVASLNMSNSNFGQSSSDEDDDGNEDDGTAVTARLSIQMQCSAEESSNLHSIAQATHAELLSMVETLLLDDDDGKVLLAACCSSPAVVERRSQFGAEHNTIRQSKGLAMIRGDNRLLVVSTSWTKSYREDTFQTWNNLCITVETHCRVFPTMYSFLRSLCHTFVEDPVQAATFTNSLNDLAVEPPNVALYTFSQNYGAVADILAHPAIARFVLCCKCIQISFMWPVISNINCFCGAGSCGASQACRTRQTFS